MFVNMVHINEVLKKLQSTNIIISETIVDDWRQTW